MPQSRSLVAVVLALSFCMPSGLADWRFTKWGMTPEQVQAAAGGTLSKATGDDACQACNPIPLLIGTYSAAGFRFRVIFQFDYGQTLSAVALRTQSKGRVSGCDDLFNSLSAKYGKPVWKSPVADSSIGNLRPTRWIDTESGNTVLFIDTSSLMGECEIKYSPLASPKGL